MRITLARHANNVLLTRNMKKIEGNYASYYKNLTRYEDAKMKLARPANNVLLPRSTKGINEDCIYYYYFFLQRLMKLSNSETSSGKLLRNILILRLVL